MKRKYYKIETTANIVGEKEVLKIPTRNYSSTEMKKLQPKSKTNRLNSLYPDIGTSNGITLKQIQKLKQVIFPKEKTCKVIELKKQTVYVNTQANFMEILKINPNKKDQKVKDRDKKKQKPKIQKVQVSNISTIKKMKFQKKITEKMKTLPKIQKQVLSTSQYSKPLLSSLDSNLRKIKSKHYFVLQYENDQPILSYRSRSKIQVASLTKIMTFYVCVQIAKDNDLNLSKQKMIVDEETEGFPGTSAQLQTGQIYTVQQLLYGLMLPSGNDAAICLAKWGGKYLTSNQFSKTRKFIKKMNDQAQKLNLKDTRYGNPHGLPHKSSETTCEDMARLCSICLKIPLFMKVVGTMSYQCTISTLQQTQYVIQWENTNKLLRRKGFLGIKTGITVTAGPCLASAYKFQDKIYIVVLAKANKRSRRFKQTRKLLVHCLQRMDLKLSEQDKKEIKRLDKANIDIDSDYSDQESQFDFDKADLQQMKKRVEILKTDE